MAGLHQRLTEFLQDSAGIPAQWPHNDCALWLASWVARVRGIDPAAHLRGAESARHLMRAAGGGMIAGIARVARQAGIARTRSPQVGDAGIVRLPNGKPIAALRTERGWAFLGEQGGVSGCRSDCVRVIAAWSV